MREAHRIYNIECYQHRIGSSCECVDSCIQTRPEVLKDGVEVKDLLTRASKLGMSFVVRAEIEHGILQLGISGSHFNSI